MTNIGKLLAHNLKNYRKGRGLSQAGLAEKADTATNYIGLIEAGKRFPSTKMLEKIAVALEIDTPELFAAKTKQESSVEKLYIEILRDFEKVITSRLHELDKKG